MSGIRVVRLAPEDAPEVRGWQFFTKEENEVWIPDNPAERPTVYLDAFENEQRIDLDHFAQSITTLQALIAEINRLKEEPGESL